MPDTPVAIGKYQIVDLVGEGAMGCVYRAHDPVLNRSVAIKVMSDAIARDAELRDRFMREAQSAGSLQHPNVVTIYDFGEFDGHLFIAMEYVEGVDLETLIEQKLPLSMDQRLGIVIDVLVGLSYAHRHGIVHRDIKPANIRIDDEGRARIMDFGVAHLDSAKMTATGVMVGTPNYMAPEQVTGQKITAATDIFSMGAVLYELMSGKKAFGAESLHNVLFKVVSEDPPPLAIVAPDAPPGLDSIVRRSLAKETADRYSSAQEMANDLTRIRSQLVGAGSESLSLSATIASQVRHSPRRPSTATAAVSRSRTVRNRVIGTAIAGAIAIAGGTWWYAAHHGATTAVESVTAPPATVADSPSVAVTPPPTAPAPAPGRQAARSPASTPETRTAPPAETRTTPPRQPSPTAASASTDESAIVSIVRGSALDARARAVGAGASESQLASGDSLLASAGRLVDARKFAEAVAAINAAGVSFGEAERIATDAAARMQAAEKSAAATRAAADSTARAAAPPVTAPTSPPPAPVPDRDASRAEPPAPSPAVQIEALVGDYARAITARDIARIRALYPGISAEQQRGFQSFFNAVKSLRATLTAGTPVIDGANATAHVTGAYDFADADGKAQHQVVSFSATFRRDGTRWHIVSVR